MSTTVEEPQFEIVPAKLGLAETEKHSLEIAFTGCFDRIREWKAKADACTDPKEARTNRLEMKKERVIVEKKVKDAKANALTYGRACDGIRNLYLAIAGPVEDQFDEIEKAEERAEAARIEALREERRDVLETLGHVSHGLNLGTLTDEQWTEYHQQAKDAFFARREREKKAKEEAEALAKKEAEEREAQRLENIRLKSEAEAREAELKAEREERERVEAAAKVEREKLEQARIAAEDKARRGREVAEAKAKAEREKIEAAAAEERRKAQEVAAIEAQKREAAEAEVKALRDAEAKRIADEKAAEAAKAKAEALAAKKAAAAPDKAKLMEFAAKLQALQSPTTTTAAGNMIERELDDRLDALVSWIETQAATL